MNKKILNAKAVEFNGIKFKSKLECKAYKVLLENGLDAKYEPQKIVLYYGYKPLIKFYCARKTGKDKGHLFLNDKKIREITYTPDFVIDYNGRNIYIEMKGFENDVSPYKLKMFIKYLGQFDKSATFFKLNTINQLIEAIKVIKTT
jgi:hypothetical protein